MKNINKKIIILVLFISVFVLNFCDFSTKPPRENQPPTTTIANIPVEQDTLFPRVKIRCDGGDSDGFIIGYEYRVKTYHLKIGDSTITSWQYVSEDSSNGILDIIFESSDSLNRQVIQVRSVDNDSAVDPTPAEKTIFTPRSIYPETVIKNPVNNSKFFFLDQMTDWWQGIKIDFSGNDADGEVVEYGWSLDDNPFTWTIDTTVNLKPEMFSDGIEGKHSIKIICRDNTNLIDSIGATVNFTFIRPKFDGNILIIDDTEEGYFPSSAGKTDTIVDSIYNKLFSPDTTIDYEQNGMPEKEFLGKYKLLIWHADNPNSRHHLPQHADIIQDYLNVGGNIIVIGWQMLKSFAYEENFPVSFEEGSFVNDYLHISEANAHQGLFGDFTGAYGAGDFPRVDVNGDLVPSFPYNGKLKLIEVVTQPGPFTEVIYTYIGEDVSLMAYPCGIMYRGTQFNVIVITFPLTFLKEENIKLFADRLIESIDYE